MTAEAQTWFESITIWQVLVALAILGTLWGVARKALKLFKPVGAFLDDWNGEPQRPGVPARKGVMARLESIEEHLKDVPTRSEFDQLHTQVQQHEVRLSQLTPPVTQTVTVNPEAS